MGLLVGWGIGGAAGSLLAAGLSSPAAEAHAVPSSPVLQYPCRPWRAALLPLRAFAASWNAPICSSAEQSQEAVAQGFPSSVRRGRRAGWWRVVALALLGSAGPGAAAAAGCVNAAAVNLRPVGPNLWRVAAARGEPDASNAGLTAQLVVVRDGARVWLIGSGPTPAFGAALACAVEHRLGRAVTDVVNTRPAPELAMGNVAFAGARLWALPDVIATMQARCLGCLERLQARIGAAGASLRPEHIRVPALPVGAPGTARGVLGPFAWRAFERAPGERVLVLRHRRERIVVAQGLLWAGDVPDLRDTRSATLRASLRALRRFAAGARLLGEQGGVAGPSALAQQIAYIDALRRAAWPHLVRGDVDGAAGAGVELPAFAGLPGYARLHRLNVQRVWRELEPTIFR